MYLSRIEDFTPPATSVAQEMGCIGGSIVDADGTYVLVTFSDCFMRQLVRMSEGQERDIIARQRLEILLGVLHVEFP
jgi:hypothetical protein